MRAPRAAWSSWLSLTQSDARAGILAQLRANTQVRLRTQTGIQIILYRTHFQA